MKTFTIFGKFFNPRVENFVAATKWKVTGRPSSQHCQQLQRTGFWSLWLLYWGRALVGLCKLDKSLCEEGACLWFCSAPPLGVGKHVGLHLHLTTSDTNSPQETTEMGESLRLFIASRGESSKDISVSVLFSFLQNCLSLFLQS